MIHRRSIVFATLVPSIVALIAACGDTTQNAPTQLNLDRPIDIAFACYGGLRLTNGTPADPSQQVADSPMPLAACDVRSQPAQACTADTDCQFTTQPTCLLDKMVCGGTPLPPGQQALASPASLDRKSVV